MADTPDALAQRIAAALVARGQTVSVAESSAGGTISSALLRIAGASAYYRGGTVIYDRASTRALLHGAVDLDPGDKGAAEPFARYLAASAQAKLRSDWAISETGATGPDPNPYGDPAGHAWVGLAGPDGLLQARHVLTGDADRAHNMVAFATAALLQLAEALRA